MLARVATFDGGQADALRRAAEEINANAASGAGPPEGVPAKGFMMLIDPERGRSISIVLFENEDDLRQGDAALNTMSPSSDDAGSRTSVESYEVAVDLRA
jgi:hypothetical protein